MNTKIKGYSLAGLAVAIVLGFTAFKAMDATSETKQDAQWFMFISPINPGEQGYRDALLNPENYEMLDKEIQPSCETGSSKVCAILATTNLNVPDANYLEQTIGDMLNPQSPNTNIIRKNQE